jgi:hypothetical protein
MTRTYASLIAARSNRAPRITAVTPPSNCTRAWGIRSNRNWRAMTDKATSKGRPMPWLVESDGSFYILTAVGKMLDGNGFYGSPDKRIGRKGFHLVTPAIVTAILNSAKYGRDGFFRSTSAHVAHDTIDIGLWLTALVGQPFEGGWEALVASWAKK